VHAGQALRLALADCGLSMAWLAARIGKSERIVRWWCTGERPIAESALAVAAPAVARAWAMRMEAARAA
jgi:hypothetical protein